MTSSDAFVSKALRNPAIAHLWNAWDQLNLPNCWLVAGCLTQTIWNQKFGLPLGHGLSDIDVVYFDATDLSEETEQALAERLRVQFPKLGLWLDVKNEARVHLWYEEKFGIPLAPYRSVQDAIDTFPTTATSVGIRQTSHGAEVYAPFGLDDLFNGIVRPNKRLITQGVYDAKVARWKTHWPELQVIPW